MTASQALWLRSHFPSGWMEVLTLDTTSVICKYVSDGAWRGALGCPRDHLQYLRSARFPYSRHGHAVLGVQGVEEETRPWVEGPGCRRVRPAEVLLASLAGVEY